LRASIKMTSHCRASCFIDCPPSVLGERERVQDQVEGEDERTQRDLSTAREPARVEQRRNLMIEEPASITRLATAAPPRVFEWSERAGPARPFDEYPPHRGRHV